MATKRIEFNMLLQRIAIPDQVRDLPDNHLEVLIVSTVAADTIWREHSEEIIAELDELNANIGQADDAGAMIQLLSLFEKWLKETDMSYLLEEL